MGSLGVESRGYGGTHRMVQQSAGTDSASMKTVEEGQSDSETIEKTPISIDIPNSPTESGSSASSESSMSLCYRMLDFGLVQYLSIKHF